MNDGGMLYRCYATGRIVPGGGICEHTGGVCGVNMLINLFGSHFETVGTLANYLGVGTGVLETDSSYYTNGCLAQHLIWREIKPEPEIDAAEVRQFIASADFYQRRDQMPRDRQHALRVIDAWLKEHTSAR